jgi:hypothetical protein
VAVPSTATWTLDTDEVVSAALERIPAKIDQAYDLAKARRALQFTFQRLLARQIANFRVSLVTLTLTADQIDYTLPADQHYVLEATIRDPVSPAGNPTDLPLERIARDEYHLIPNKESRGRPHKFWVQRGRDARSLHFWPKPDRAYVVRYQHVSLFRDVGGALDHLDVPQTWLSVLVAGTAYFLAISKPEIDIPTRQEMERLFEKEVDLIESEDRDRASLRIVPDLSAYTGFGY